MTKPHLWVRAEHRSNESRVGLTPDGAAHLRKAGFSVTVERSDTRIFPIEAYQAAGCDIAPAHSWRAAPKNAIILGLKELPEDGSPLPHTHIMFGHAFKGQGSGRALLDRFKAGGGTLLDLEYLTNADGRRVAAFGYWAGYAGAAVSLMCWAAQQQNALAGAVSSYSSADALNGTLQSRLADCDTANLDALVIGANGRVGTGAADLCTALNIPVTRWDMAETAHGGPFPEILQHQLFFNCILAGPQTPRFVPRDTGSLPRRLRVIGDIACDPDSDYNPVPLYSSATTWEAPALRVHQQPPLDVMAIDNLPSMLPLESSEDFAAQLLPTLAGLADDPNGIWARARQTFQDHL